MSLKSKLNAVVLRKRRLQKRAALAEAKVRVAKLGGRTTAAASERATV